jgi:dihydrofolate reductase
MLVMEGGTTFTFVTDGTESALAKARAATINQYLAAGLIHELRLHVAPVILGSGERLFAGVRDVDLEHVSTRCTELVTHITYRIAR